MGGFLYFFIFLFMTQTIVIKIGTESLTQFETSEKIYILIQTIVEKIAE